MKRLFKGLSLLMATASASSINQPKKDLNLADLPSVDADEFDQLWFNNTIDHFNYQDERTYGQRYWINNKYFDEEGDGPIFINICGEYTCSVNEKRMFPFMLGAAHNASLVAIEHRFYGNSQPFNTWETENLKYLSAEQALADLATFIGFLTKEKKRQVLVIGGSYPGALSAWFREKYPHMAVGSWASSAVVYPEKDMWKFDEQVYLSTVKSGSECPKTIQNIFKSTVEGIKNSTEERNEIFKIMGASPNMDDGDFSFFFADIFVESVQYGNRTGLCDLMDSIKDMNLTEQLQHMKVAGDAAGVGVKDYCRNALKNTTIIDSPGRPWTYQYCSSFGFYQTPSHLHKMRPQGLLGEQYWVDYCKDIFGIDLHLDRALAEFAGYHTEGTNTIFVNGAEDPWQWVTELNPKSHLNQKSIMADCEDCGHCVDLSTPADADSDELSSIREQIITYVGNLLEDDREKDRQTVWASEPELEFIQA